jgi:hypothetical protein
VQLELRRPASIAGGYDFTLQCGEIKVKTCLLTFTKQRAVTSKRISRKEGETIVSGFLSMLKTSHPPKHTGHTPILHWTATLGGKMHKGVLTSEEIANGDVNPVTLLSLTALEARLNVLAMKK